MDIFVKRRDSLESGEDHPFKLFSVESGGVQNVPLHTAYNEELFFKPGGTE